jgi:hypothetical protein
MAELAQIWSEPDSMTSWMDSTNGCGLMAPVGAPLERTE